MRLSYQKVLLGSIAPLLAVHFNYPSLIKLSQHVRDQMVVPHHALKVPYIQSPGFKDDFQEHNRIQYVMSILQMVDFRTSNYHNLNNPPNCLLQNRFLELHISRRESTEYA
ncbi:MAG: hypothetical protein MUO53_02655 [Maribacter sp.]|nr:hypothetical protein [Maribacter sp.]